VATNIYMPALGMAQETGRLVHWHKAPGAGM
jgi:pyruvate/2-oxoglutarate dehydrogenase complex dihydrolipoamide acyltransferase (E2) component